MLQRNMGNGFSGQCRVSYMHYPVVVCVASLQVRCPSNQHVNFVTLYDLEGADEYPLDLTCCVCHIIYPAGPPHWYYNDKYTYFATFRFVILTSQTGQYNYGSGFDYSQTIETIMLRVSIV